MSLIFNSLVTLVLASTVVHVGITTRYDKYGRGSSLLSKSVDLYGYGSVDESGDVITDADKLSIYSKPSKPCFFFCNINK